MCLWSLRNPIIFPLQAEKSGIIQPEKWRFENGETPENQVGGQLEPWGISASAPRRRSHRPAHLQVHRTPLATPPTQHLLVELDTELLGRALRFPWAEHRQLPYPAHPQQYSQPNHSSPAFVHFKHISTWSLKKRGKSARGWIVFTGMCV